MYRRTFGYCVFLMFVPIIVLAQEAEQTFTLSQGCLLYTSDAADE